MIEALKKLLGIDSQSPDFKQLLGAGAQIVDVRSPGEYASGHIKGSVNIPLQTLSHQLGKLRKDKVVITVCASGMRSASAKSILMANGFKEVYNGGGWSSLKAKIQ